jgi:aerobic carbon-monoxide dehydrogenase medium subunit
VKPPPFQYHRPSTVEEALAVLDDAGHDGKVLAGGQSLVPLLNMRLAAPAHLVDVNRLAELAYVRTDAEAVRVGAVARHAEVEHDADAHGAVPLLRQALTDLAHPTIRNRGTVVGSLVHADPAGELPAVLALLGGTMELAAAGGRRTVPADGFFVGPLESALRPGELATEAVFPRPPARSGSAWREVARRHGDYALCGVGVLVTLDEDRRVAAARAACISVGPTPVVVDLAEAVGGRPHDAADWAAAGALAAARVDPEDDIHASAAYRRHLAGVLTARAGRAAADAAGRLGDGGSGGLEASPPVDGGSGGLKGRSGSPPGDGGSG